MCRNGTQYDMDYMAAQVTDLMRNVRARVGLYARSRADADREIREAIEEQATKMAVDMSHRDKYLTIIRDGARIPISDLPVSDNFASRGIDESLQLSTLNLPGGRRSIAEINALYDDR